MAERSYDGFVYFSIAFLWRFSCIGLILAFQRFKAGLCVSIHWISAASLTRMKKDISTDWKRKAIS